MLQLGQLKGSGLQGCLVARALRLPLAEAERLRLVAPLPWGRLAWSIEANRVRRRRREAP